MGARQHGTLLALLCTLLFCHRAAAGTLQPDAALVVQELQHLATFSDDPNPAVTRVLFTENDVRARDYVKQLMREAGLTVREDSVGNIFGRWEGSDPAAGAVLTGSHCDAIPLAGAYDGTVGVIGAIEALRALKRAGFSPVRSLEVLMFTSEEPTRFGLSCIGSRAMAGALPADELAALSDGNGVGFAEASAAAGYPGQGSLEATLSAARLPPGRYAYFLELHIEQGPLLEAEGTDIGIVTAIAAPAALEVKFFGDGGHAGALLMPFRNDAGLAAAELALVVENATLTLGDPKDTVGTVGIMDLKPGAVNSVPREARMTVDIRDIDGSRRDAVVDTVTSAAAAIAARRKVRHTVEFVNRDPPATCDAAVVDAVAQAVAAAGLSSKRMVSRAYHDSLFVARVVPTGMVFIPCRGGVSHRPDEFASEKAIKDGITALALAMARLSGGSFAAGDHAEL